MHRPESWREHYREVQNLILHTARLAQWEGSALTKSLVESTNAPPNKALQLTANPLRGLSAAELGRYAQDKIRRYKYVKGHL